MVFLDLPCRRIKLTAPRSPRVSYASFSKLLWNHPYPSIIHLLQKLISPYEQPPIPCALRLFIIIFCPHNSLEHYQAVLPRCSTGSLPWNSCSSAGWNVFTLKSKRTPVVSVDKHHMHWTVKHVRQWWSGGKRLSGIFQPRLPMDALSRFGIDNKR